jgi:hypothetical protein
VVGYVVDASCFAAQVMIAADAPRLFEQETNRAAAVVYLLHSYAFDVGAQL